MTFASSGASQKFQKILSKPSSLIASSQPSNASKKGAYRLFSNPKITPNSILDAHRSQTLLRCQNAKKTLFCIQDTTDISVHNHRNLAQNLGHNVRHSKDNQHIGNTSYHLHTSLCVTSDAIPLGIIDQQIYTHDNRNTATKEDAKKRPIEEKESYRWINALRNCKETLGSCPSEVIMLADREADIYEYLQEAQEISQKIIVRSRGDRKEFLQKLPLMTKAGSYSFFHDGTQTHHILSVAYEAVTFSAPKRHKEAKGKPLQDVTYTIVYVKEENVAKGSKGIEWILLTNMSVGNFEEAYEIVRGYGYRWHIENFHKVLKTSFKLDEAQLETFEGLIVLATTVSILSYRLYYMIHYARVNSDAPCTAIVERSEWQALWIYKDKKIPLLEPSCERVIIEIAMLGGYMNRKSDKKPGILVISRGWHILQNMHQMYLRLSDNEKD
jgi:hypothetical protein